MTADEDEYQEYKPPTEEDAEYDPTEQKYRGIGGPKDINAADWWKNNE